MFNLTFYNFIMKRILLLVVALSTIFSAMAQKPKWEQELDEVYKLEDLYLEQKNWKKLVECMEKEAKIILSQPDSVRIAYMGSEELSANGYYYNHACYNALAGNKAKALKSFEEFTDKAIGKEEIDLNHIRTDSDLNSLREEARFKACMERLSKWGDYKLKLKEAGTYSRGYVPEGFRFRYASPNDPDLVRLRKEFNLDSITGAGDEISKIKNLLHWVHEVVRHDGGSSNPEIKNTIDIIKLCRKENRGVNCRMMAQMLAEVYLAMGFKARYVTCLPRDFVSDCHVITTVYSCTLDKWLWVDPTFDAYVMDENDTMLSIAEVRERLRMDKFLKINDYANWNNRSKQTKEDYIDRYMAKNLYYLACAEWSRFNAETYIEGRQYRYIALMPYDMINKDTGSAVQWYYLRVSDDKWFWQSPYNE